MFAGLRCVAILFIDQHDKRGINNNDVRACVIVVPLSICLSDVTLSFSLSLFFFLSISFHFSLSHGGGIDAIFQYISTLPRYQISYHSSFPACLICFLPQAWFERPMSSPSVFFHSFCNIPTSPTLLLLAVWFRTLVSLKRSPFPLPRSSSALSVTGSKLLSPNG